MPTSARTSICCLIGLLMFSQTACNLVPAQTLRQSQFRARQLHQQNRALAAERDRASRSAQSLTTEMQRLRQGLETANHRIGNLKTERSSIQRRYVGLLNRSQRSPLSDETTRRFQELAEQYPGFEFDPQTGVSKFHSDILFASGSDHIKPQGIDVLRKFAGILNAGAAKRLNILVVGHTDDKPIIKRSTRSKHPTNWHLSTNRANSVVLALKKSGLKEDRMGVAGYSMFQPVVPNKGSKSRQINRRVEIFVLAPDAIVAGWEPATSRN